MLGRADLGDGAAYRTGARTADLLHHHPTPPTGIDTPVLVRAPGQQPPACLGGSLAWLLPPPTHTPTGDVVRVITDTGVWLGFLAGRDHPAADVAPPPVTSLDRMPGDMVIIAVEATVPLRARDRT